MKGGGWGRTSRRVCAFIALKPYCAMDVDVRLRK